MGIDAKEMCGCTASWFPFIVTKNITIKFSGDKDRSVTVILSQFAPDFWEILLSSRRNMRSPNTYFTKPFPSIPSQKFMLSVCDSLPGRSRATINCLRDRYHASRGDVDDALRIVSVCTYAFLGRWWFEGCLRCSEECDTVLISAATGR